MEESRKKKQVLQWHPAFYAGLQIEFSEEAEKLIFENEHQLGTKPREIDVLIIKKNPKERINKNIGRIFRTYNIVEYKSPEDYLSIDDYYKVCGYACFYKSDAPRINAIQTLEITVSFVCRNYPYRLMKHLKEERKLYIEKQEAGIFYITGEVFPIQLIVTARLSAEDNLWLRNLTNDLKQDEEIECLLKDYRDHQKNTLYKSVMNLIIRANREKFEEEKEMCEALQELYQDEFDALRELYHDEFSALRQSFQEKVDAFREKLDTAKEELDSTQEKLNSTQEKLDSTQEKLDSTQEKLDNTQEKLDSTQEKLDSTQEKLDSTQEKLHTAQEKLSTARAEGIYALIADNLEEGIPRERIIEKLQKRFGLTANTARDYFEKYEASPFMLS